jgi:hypothetical protein
MLIVHFDKGRIRVQQGNLRAGAGKVRRHSKSDNGDGVEP